MRFLPLPTGHPRRHHRRGFTFPELLTTLVILAILMVAAFQGYSKLRQRAEKVDTITKLKNMYTALTGYVADKHDWPHEPEDADHEQLWEWWMNTMKPWGLQQDAWFSSAHLRVVNRQRKESGQKTVEMSEMGKDSGLKIPSFFPGKFDDYDEAYSSRYQPWVSETGEYRGDSEGHMVITPGGTVSTMPSMSAINSYRNSGKK
ncbi:MAG: type II secretion system protein [Verrucomicrobiaceae bacterium]|nr:MAG: type II secretion system protein [Verrucomicrobiaceae bacterium]